MRIGVFGGSFDPIHYGHLLLAESCRDQCSLDRVLFVPAATAPHKRNAASTAGSQRVEMLHLAIGGHPNFEVSLVEFDRGGISYTVDTLSELHRQFPSEELFFLMGADSLAEMSSWRSPDQICQLACPIVVRRLGAPEPDLQVLAGLVNASRLEKIRECLVEMPATEFSSTHIRQTIAAGRSIRYQTPRAVEMYIRENGLFRD